MNWFIVFSLFMSNVAWFQFMKMTPWRKWTRNYRPPFAFKGSNVWPKISTRRPVAMPERTFIWCRRLPFVPWNRLWPSNIALTKKPDLRLTRSWDSLWDRITTTITPLESKKKPLKERIRAHLAKKPGGMINLKFQMDRKPLSRCFEFGYAI